MQEEALRIAKTIDPETSLKHPMAGLKALKLLKETQPQAK